MAVCTGGWLLFNGLVLAQEPQGGRGPRIGQGGFGGQFGSRGSGRAAEDQTPLKPEEYCSAEGTVLHGATGEPLRKAAVTLRSASGRRERLSATTDEAGRFRIDNVEPGDYRLQVERTGFVRQEYGATRPGRSGRVLTLDKGKHLTGVVFRMTPQGVVTGRVADEDGEPVLYASVSALRQGYVGGQKQLVPAGQAVTNDLGEYRLHSLPPGRYYLSASLRWNGMTPDSGDEPEERYVPTYYPAATDPASASLLEVTPGGVVAGIEFRLRRARTVSVRGKVENAPTEGRGIGLWLMPRDQPMGIQALRRNTRLSRDGTFEFGGVSPGSYVLGADSMGRGERMSARMDVQVGTSDLNGVSLHMVPGIELPIQFRTEEDSPIDYKTLRVSLTGSIFPFFGRNSWQVSDAGAATATQLAPESYRITVSGLPANFYVRSMRLTDREIAADGVNLGSGGGALQILLSPKAGQVSGVVMNSAGLASTTATVVVAPADPVQRNDPSRIKSIGVDTSGGYSIGGLPPGDYLAFAFEDLESGASQDPEYLKAFETKASKLTIQASGSESLKLTEIASEQQSLAQDRGEISQR